MNLCSIASGSSGNCIYTGSDSTHFIVDAGISGKRVENGLNQIGLSVKDLDGILITHEHIDHISGLGVLTRKYQVPVFATKETIVKIKMTGSLGELPEGIFHEIEAGEPFQIKDLKIMPFSISHDAVNPVAYTIEGNGKKIGIATDLGTYDDRIVECLYGMDALLLEANHDINMLQVGRYPYYLKKRILGDKGHLSNESSGRLLCRLLHDRLQTVLLGHLSKENNYEELAKETVCLEINMDENRYQSSDFRIEVVKRDRRSELITV
jgi:phosphoribosyl 1,2-cyclic phosphodiesterase